MFIKDDFNTFYSWFRQCAKVFNVFPAKYIVGHIEGVKTFWIHRNASLCIKPTKNTRHFRNQQKINSYFAGKKRDGSFAKRSLTTFLKNLLQNSSVFQTFKTVLKIVKRYQQKSGNFIAKVAVNLGGTFQWLQNHPHIQFFFWISIELIENKHKCSFMH